MDVHFCKYLFITTYAEINKKKYMSFEIHHYTICPTFGSISGKQIIQSFFHLRISIVVNIMDYFVGDLGAYFL